MKAYYGLLIIILFTMQSCFRCDKEHTYNLTDKTKSYFGIFLIGEKWIFKKSSDSTYIDTLTLSNKSQELEFSYTETECDGDYFEIITYQLISSDLVDTLTASLRSGPNIDIYSLRGIYDGVEIACYHDINKISEEFEYNSYLGDQLNIIETYNLNGLTYNGVIDITFNQFSRLFPEKAPRYFHSRNVGLIEFEIYNELLNKRVNYSLMKKI
tara:strand:- start:1130 stop:1765 length:636 start_codon:yes stop_codon:yes gene_type:complete